MGVKYLQQFAETYPDVFKDLDLAAFAEYNVCGPRPTVLVDTMNCQSFFYKGLDVLCGGQGREFVQRLEDFLNVFDRLGIDLIFVADGCTKPGCHEKTKLRRWKKIFESVKTVLKSPDEETISKITCDLLPNLSLQSILQQIFKREICSVEKQMSWKHVICNLAKDPNRNVVGILTQDSDFMVLQYPLNVHLLAVKSIDFSNLPKPGDSWIVKEYDRVGLAHVLGLKTTQLPMFAILRGNDFLPQEAIDRFHLYLKGDIKTDDNIGNFPTEVLFKLIADFVTGFDLPGGADITSTQLDLLTKLFGDSSIAKTIPDLLKYYFCKDHVLLGDPEEEEPITGEWGSIVNLFAPGSFVRNIVMELSKPIPPLIQFYNQKKKRPTTWVAFKTLRLRAYGILLFEKPGAFDSKTNQFQIKWHQDVYEGKADFQPTNEYTIVSPLEFHPGLKRLMLEKSDEITVISWKLFAFFLCPEMDWEELRKVPKEFICPVAHLLAFQNEYKFPILKEWEVKLFLIHHKQLLEMSLTDLKEVKSPPKPLNSRCIHLASLYTDDFITRISHIFPALEIQYQDLSPCLNFNGVLLQQKYQMYLGNESFDGIATQEELDEVKVYYDLITFQGTQIRENFA